MSILTHLLETTPHFGHAIEEAEQKLKISELPAAEKLKLLVELAYCYAHVQLQKGEAAANEAITLGDKLNDQGMKANALCAKAMNQFRIGYVAQAKATARQALSIFETLKDEEGKCDAYFQLGSMPYINEGPGDAPKYLEEAFNRYKYLGNITGVYLARIQQSIQLFFATRFDEGISEVKTFIEELSAPHQRHLRCFAYMQLSIGMHIKQDVVQFGNYLVEWQKIAKANGNFHDYSMTKAILPDCYRIQQIDKDVMKAGLEGIECTDKLGSIHGHSTAAIVMGHICIGQGQYDDALFYYRKAMAAAREIDDSYKYLMSLNGVGEVYLKSGQITEARQTFESIREEASVINDRLNLIAANRHLAEIAYQQGEFDRALFDFKILFDTSGTSEGWNIQDYRNYASSIAKASNNALQKANIKPEERNTLRLQYLEKYFELSEKQQNKREGANAFNALAEYYEETNDLNRAIQYRKKYIQLYEEMVNEQSIKSMTDLRMHYETEKKEKEIVLLKKESEHALLNERLRISRELHDDIGSTLGSISIYSEVAKSRIEKNENSHEALSKIGITSRELIDKMSDIVWSLNPNNEGFEQLETRMHAVAAMILTPRNILYNFIVAEEITKVQLSAEEQKNVFLIYKEAIHNIVKYAACKKVEVKLSTRNNQLAMEIKDDGKGFDANAESIEIESLGGNGIKNMKARAESMNAKFKISSKPGEGTAIELVLGL